MGKDLTGWTDRRTNGHKDRQIFSENIIFDIWDFLVRLSSLLLQQQKVVQETGSKTVTSDKQSKLVKTTPLPQPQGYFGFNESFLNWWLHK